MLGARLSCGSFLSDQSKCHNICYRSLYLYQSLESTGTAEQYTCSLQADTCTPRLTMYMGNANWVRVSHLDVGAVLARKHLLVRRQLVPTRVRDETLPVHHPDRLRADWTPQQHERKTVCLTNLHQIVPVVQKEHDHDIVTDLRRVTRG